MKGRATGEVCRSRSDRAPAPKAPRSRTSSTSVRGGAACPSPLRRTREQPPRTSPLPRSSRTARPACVRITGSAVTKQHGCPRSRLLPDLAGSSSPPGIRPTVTETITAVGCGAPVPCSRSRKARASRSGVPATAAARRTGAREPRDRLARNVPAARRPNVRHRGGRRAHPPCPTATTSGGWKPTVAHRKRDESFLLPRNRDNYPRKGHGHPACAVVRVRRPQAMEEGSRLSPVPPMNLTRAAPSGSRPRIRTPRSRSTTL